MVARNGITRLLPHAAVLAVIALVLGPGSSQRSHAETPPPDPIDPNNAEQTLLDLVNGLPINEIENALDNYPVPYVVIATAGGADPVILNEKAGSPARIDADQSTGTGQGGSGHDLIVEVNTELLPTPHLVLTIERLGEAPFASDLQVLVAFPYDAFNGEDASAGGDSPNLFFGYQTTAAFNGTEYPAGGHAPQLVEFVLTPGTLAGTNHEFALQINTTGADNPVQFLAGHFDGPPAATAQDVIGIGIHTDPVPASITLGLDIDASAILSGGTTTGNFAIDWAASAPARVEFDYIEKEGLPLVGSDYGTSVIADQMPTDVSLTIGLDFAAPTLTLDLATNAQIDDLTVLHSRSDGLDVVAHAHQVPTQVSLTLDFNGQLILDVNANTMDFDLTATQDGGFPGSDSFFGHPMEFFYAAATDIPDMTVTYDGTAQDLTLTTPNAGEFVGSIAFIMDDDAAALGDPEIELPPDQTPLGTGVGEPWEDPDRHIFSLIDDGTHGTAAARLLGVDEASLTLNSGSLSDVGEEYLVTLADAKPLTAYVDLVDPAAKFLQGTGISDLEATCNVHDFPEGTVDFDLSLPPPDVDFTFTTVPDGQVIEELFCTGNINTLFFEVTAGQVPAGIHFTFTPADNAMPDAQGSLVLTTPSPVGKLGVRLWVPGPDTLDDNGFATANLLGVALDDARFLANTIPDLTATWSDGTNTNISFTTPGVGEPSLGGLQVGVSTILSFTSQFPTPTASTGHYMTLVDGGGALEKTLTAGAFGIDEFTYTSDSDGLAVHYAADAARLLTVDVDSTFGRFFEDYFIDAVLTVDDVPQTFDFNTNMRTEVHYTASSGIDAIDLNGDVDNSGPDITDKTTIHFDADGLPATVDFVLTPESGATLTMSAPIELIALDLSSDVSIFGSDYKHIAGSIAEIPANWTAAWGTSPNPHASLSTSAPLGPVSLVLSEDIKANTPSKYDPFTVAGGAVQYTPFAREIDRRYFRQGAGDDATRETVFMSRLDGLYTSTSQLDPGEDHVIIRDGFTSVQGTGFQCASAQIGPGSFQCVAETVNPGEANASLLLPVAGEHPLYVALEQSGGSEFLTIQVPDVPDSAGAVVGPTRANLDFSGSPGDILIYKGALPGVNDFQDALKVQLINTPSFIHASWNLGLPGGITIDTPGVLEVRLLTQSGSDRTVVDFGVGDLSANWGINTAEFEFFDCKQSLPFPPFAAECGTWFTIVDAFASFTATPGIEGFIANYQAENNPQDLTPDPPAKNEAEYVPRLHLYVENLTSISGNASIDVCAIPLPLPIPCVAPGVPVPHINLSVSGDFNFDFWDLGGGPANILGDPDYINNDPWDLFPFAHSQDDHLFPFSP